MDKERRIAELREKIDMLSIQAESFQRELARLRGDLNQIMNDDQSLQDPHISLVEESRVIKPSGLENLIGLRFMHLAGIVALVTGLAIGVKYAIDQKLISELTRILLAYVAGAILFLLAAWLRKKYSIFSAILFGGSMASLYFTTYGAAVFYHFIPVTAAFAIMAALTVFTVFEAMSYDREEIAILGMVGAYAIPFLVSANSQRFDLFFSYILLINLGVVFIAFRREWRWMQSLALAITWIIFFGWLLTGYDENWHTTANLFLGLYYLLFLASAIGRNLRSANRLKPLHIRQILVNNMLAYLAAGPVMDSGFLDLDRQAFVALLAAIIIGLLAISLTILMPSEKFLQRSIVIQSLGLLVLFVLFQWSGVTVLLLWMIMAVSLFVVGIVYKQSWPRLAAVILIAFTLLKLTIFDRMSFTTGQKIISYVLIGVLLLLFSFYYQKLNLPGARKGK